MFNNERLKRLRKEAKLNQSDVALKLNIKRETYTRYETGTITPPPDVITVLAKLFEVSTDYLLSNTNDPTPPGKKDAPLTADEAFRIWAAQSELSEKDQKELEGYIDLLKIRANARKMNEQMSVKANPAFGH